MSKIEAMRQAWEDSAADVRVGGRPGDAGAFSLRGVVEVLLGAACYYLATRIAWVLCFPDSKVSLFFPPHAILVSILLLVSTRRWPAFVLAAAGAHLIATQQAGWPLLYALQCEAFDAVKTVLVAAGIRIFIRSPFHRITLREAIFFVLIAVVIVPFGTAFWGAAFTVSNNFGSHYWVEWRNLGVSNGVTAIVLVPVVLLGAHYLSRKGTRVAPVRILEACVLAACIFAIGYLAFDHVPAGPETSPALLYAPVPLLIWAALRFGLGGMSAAMLVTTMMAILGTMHGHGPFLTQTPEQNALALQLFILVVATPLLLLAVAISDERHSKEALRLTEERMALAAESAQLALWDWDVANDRIWLAGEGHRFLGLEADTFIDHSTLAGRVHPDDRAMRAEAIERTLATGGAYEAEFRILLPDGSVRWLAARGRRLGIGDGVERVRGVALDITQQKLASAEAQEQRDELAHLSRAATLSTLSGSLAHELSQPLSSILSNAQAGLHFLDKEPPDVEELRALLAIIVGEERRAGDIIGRLRTMLRRGHVSLQPVSVNECLDELLRLTRSDLAARGIRVRNLAAAGTPPAHTDRVQLQQVLLNLILNACDAMQSNAPGDRQLTLTTTVEDGELRIGVLDCGVGLPDDAEALFKPFYTTKEAGLGMGLSICRTLLATHRGRVWAEHGDGRGAAFYVALPLAGAAAGEKT